MADGGIEERVQVLEDRAEITQVIYRYVMGIATRDLEMLLSVYADDAHLDFDFIQLDGIDDVRAFFSNQSTDRPKNPLALDKTNSSNPLVANILIDIDGDRAHAESRGFVVHHGERDGRELFVMRPLLFSDDLVRRDGAWKILVRKHPHPPWTLELEQPDVFPAN